jgi:hypothetical protein
MVAETQLRYSQRESQSQTQLVPDTQLDTLLSQLSKTPSISSPDDSSSKSLTDSNVNAEPRRSGRVKRPTRDKASQLSQEAAAAKAKAKGEGKGKSRKMRKSILTSQLLEEFAIDLE